MQLRLTYITLLLSLLWQPLAEPVHLLLHHSHDHELHETPSSHEHLKTLHLDLHNNCDLFHRPFHQQHAHIDTPEFRLFYLSDSSFSELYSIISAHSACFYSIRAPPSFV